MADDWRKYLPAGEASAPAPQAETAADWTKYLPEKTSGLGSAARGALQELTFGFADEIAGGVESLFTKKSYKQARDESRANYAKAEADNPTAYTAGQVAGGLASLAIPVGAVGRAASTGAKVARAAGAGGLYGAGKSEAEDLGGLAKDTATGAALGAGVYGAGKLAGKAVGAGVGKVRELASKGGPVADTIKQVVANRAATAVIGGAADLLVGGGGITGTVVGALAPKAAEAVRKLLARGEVKAARAVSKAGADWEKIAGPALAKAELHSPAPRTSPLPEARVGRRERGAAEPPPRSATDRWAGESALALHTPELAPAAPRTTATAPAPTFEPPPTPGPRPTLGRNEKGQFLSLKETEKQAKAEAKQQAKAPKVEEPAPAPDDLVQLPRASQADFVSRVQSSAGASLKRQAGRPAIVPDGPPTAPAPDTSQLKDILTANRAQAIVPKDDRSTVDALRNIVSSSSREGNIAGLKHYPVEPDVAFQQYLAELPRSTGSSAKGRREALSKLIIGVRNGEDPGEHIYRARAAGVPDEAIMRAVGVQPAGKAAGAGARKIPPTGAAGTPAAPAAPVAARKKTLTIEVTDQ